VLDETRGARKPSAHKALAIQRMDGESLRQRITTTLALKELKEFAP
jgi:hypothetical protein